jgi:hypothetical protein
VLSRLVLEHRVLPRDPLAREGGALEDAAAALLLADAPVSMDAAAALATS